MKSPEMVRAFVKWEELTLSWHSHVEAFYGAEPGPFGVRQGWRQIQQVTCDKSADRALRRAERAVEKYNKRRRRAGVLPVKVVPSVRRGAQA